MMKNMRVMIGVYILGAAFATTVAGRSGLIIFDGERYYQEIPTRDSAAYRNWNPGVGACPLQPTNAIALAINAVTNTIPNTCVNLQFTQVSLQATAQNTVWYYSVSLRLNSTTNDTSGVRSLADVVVRLDGIVPPFTIMRPPLTRRFGSGFRARPEATPVEPRLTPEEQQRRREEIRKNLQDYQMAVIRSGMAPLPVPLTQKMDDQLVKEGVLPPVKPGLTPEEQDQKRKEIREPVQRNQMERIRAGKPPLSFDLVPLTEEQKMELEKEGFIFFEDGSFSNTVKGIHYPAVR